MGRGRQEQRQRAGPGSSLATAEWLAQSGVARRTRCSWKAGRGPQAPSHRSLARMHVAWGQVQAFLRLNYAAIYGECIRGSPCSGSCGRWGGKRGGESLGAAQVATTRCSGALKRERTLQAAPACRNGSTLDDLFGRNLTEKGPGSTMSLLARSLDDILGWRGALQHGCHAAPRGQRIGAAVAGCSAASTLLGRIPPPLRPVSPSKSQHRSMPGRLLWSTRGSRLLSRALTPRELATTWPCCPADCHPLTARSLQLPDQHQWLSQQRTSGELGCPCLHWGG